MARKPYYGVWRVQWTNPYTSPPDERNRVLAEGVVEDWYAADERMPPERLIALADQNPGYGISWGWRPAAPRRRWSKEAKARERHRRLCKRMNAKYPLFAEQFIEQELKNRASYYAAEDPLYDQ